MLRLRVTKLSFKPGARSVLIVVLAVLMSFAAVVLPARVAMAAEPSPFDPAAPWRLASEPSGPGNPVNIVCPSATRCFSPISARAAFNSYGIVQQRIDQWDGQHWTASPGSTDLGAGTAWFNQVSCDSASHCLASVGRVVGQGRPAAGFMLWNGTSWSLDPNTSFANADLPAISCSGGTFCAAVGFPNNISTDPPPLLAHWDGKAWAVDAAPDGLKASMNSVSCSSNSNCLAIGSSQHGNVAVVAWNGSAWRAIPEGLSKSSEMSLAKVACLSPDLCYAVGGRRFKDGVFAPSPVVWKIAPVTGVVTEVPAAAPSGDLESAMLSSIYCADQARCVAIGTYKTRQADASSQTLAEVLSGSGWAAASSETPAVDTAKYALGVNDVSCPTASICLAVGGNTSNIAPTQAYGLSVGAAAAGVPPPTTEPTPTPSACTGDAVLIAARGSGDNPTGNTPGRHALAIAKRLRDTYHLRLIDAGQPATPIDKVGNGSVIGVAYPSVSVTNTDLTIYNPSVQYGISSMLASIDGVRRACGRAFPILLTGYSQGAEVAQAVIQKLAATTDGQGQSIAGAVLLASPKFSPDDPAARGTYAAAYPLSGIHGHELLPTRAAATTRSYCLANDPVCNFSPVNLARHTAIHTQQYNDDPRRPNVPGAAIAADAAGLLAWTVKSKSGGTVAPRVTGQLTAVREVQQGNNFTVAVRLAASAVYANGAPTVRFKWDFTSRGTVDEITSVPMVRHVYGQAPPRFIRGAKPQGPVMTTVQIEHADGTITVRKICVRMAIVGATTC